MVLRLLIVRLYFDAAKVKQWVDVGQPPLGRRGLVRLSQRSQRAVVGLLRVSVFTVNRFVRLYVETGNVLTEPEQASAVRRKERAAQHALWLELYTELKQRVKALDGCGSVEQADNSGISVAELRRQAATLVDASALGGSRAILREHEVRFLLELVDAEPHLYLRELRARLLRRFPRLCRLNRRPRWFTSRDGQRHRTTFLAVSTVHAVLVSQHVSLKQLRLEAKAKHSDRVQQLRRDFERQLAALQLHPAQLLSVDESHHNAQAANRGFGRARLGLAARANGRSGRR
jgi:hypothetical protein